MDLSSFYVDMEKMKKWFNKKLSPEQEDQWFSKIKFIPNEAWPDIVNAITDNSKYFPTPDTVKECWRDWRQVHSNRIAPETEKTWCDECGAEGCFLVWYLPKKAELKKYLVNGSQFENYYHKIVPCSMCENWKRVFPIRGSARPGQFYTKERILSNGWLLEDPYDTQEHKQKIADSLEV